MYATVVAVCINNQKGLKKYPRSEVIVGSWGISGDYHNRQYRPRHKDPTAYTPNIDRQVSVVALEVLKELNLNHGDLGENFTVDGLGDLSQLAPGARIALGPKLILRLVEQNQPCNQVAEAYGRDACRTLVNRRGLLCMIESGHGSIVCPGHSVRLLESARSVA